MKHYEEQINKLEQGLSALLKQDIDQNNSDQMLEGWSDHLCLLFDIEINLMLATYKNAADQEAEDLYESFAQRDKPKLDSLNTELSDKITKLQLKSSNYPEVLHQFEVQKQLNTQETINLDKDIYSLLADYDKLRSSVSVEIDGQMMSWGQALDSLEVTADRNKREQIWKEIHLAKSEHYDTISDIFLKLINLRKAKAFAAGVNSFRDYQWLVYNRDYDPADALLWVDSIAEAMKPVEALYSALKAKQLGLEVLKPWDEDFIVKQSNQEKPRTLNELLNLTQKIYGDLDDAFGTIIKDMIDAGDADIEPRPNKIPSNMTAYTLSDNKPIILASLTGNLSDLETLVHEFAHAIHLKLSIPSNSYWHKQASTEVLELIAFTLTKIASFELLQNNLISKDELKTLNLKNMQFGFEILKKVPTYETFQNQVYSMEKLDREKLIAIFAAIKPVSSVDWSAEQEHWNMAWQNNLVISMPFYNIDYLFAWIGSILLFEHYLNEPQQTIKAIKAVMKLGSSVGVTSCYEKLGIALPFSDQDLQITRNLIENELN